LDVLDSLEIAMRITLSALIAIVFTISLCAQAPSPKPALSKIWSIEKESGWQIPGLAQSRIRDKRKLIPKGYGVDGVALHITVFKPRREARATISLFGLKEDGKTLVMGERTGAVQSIIKCDIENRVFVYIVSFYALVADASGHIGHSGIYGAQYFDNDGDGVFESYEPGPPLVTPELRIPEWARRSSRVVGTYHKVMQLTAR
jgi:hypothetical protein